MHLRMLSGNWEALPSGYMQSTCRSERNNMHLRMLSGKWEALPSVYMLLDM